MAVRIASAHYSRKRFRPRMRAALHLGDFFAEREGRLFPSEEELSRAGRGDEAVSWGEYFAASDEQLNAWDIILREHSGGNWYDIESAITEWVGSGFERAYADIADKINSSPAEVALALVNSCSACRTRPTP